MQINNQNKCHTDCSKKVLKLCPHYPFFQVQALQLNLGLTKLFKSTFRAKKQQAFLKYRSPKKSVFPSQSNMKLARLCLLLCDTSSVTNCFLFFKKCFAADVNAPALHQQWIHLQRVAPKKRLNNSNQHHEGFKSLYNTQGLWQDPIHWFPLYTRTIKSQIEVLREYISKSFKTSKCVLLSYSH